MSIESIIAEIKELKSNNKIHNGFSLLGKCACTE